MSTERSLPRYLLPVSLVMFLICGVASMPVAAADSSTDSFCVELDGDIDGCQSLYLNGICITDCEGNQFAFNDPMGPLPPINLTRINSGVTVIDLSGSGLNCDKPFKEVKLHLILLRAWGFMLCCQRYDKFTLDVTDLVTKTEYEPNTVKLKADDSYRVGKADAVTIYDYNKNELIHFSSTHDDGHFGGWDYSPMDWLSLQDWLCVELDGDIGDFQKLYLNGVCITDSDGNQFASDQVISRASSHHPGFEGGLDDICGKVFAEISLSCSGLNWDKPFKEVKLHLTLKRIWGFGSVCERYDMFTLDVTDLVTKMEYEPNTVKLKAYNSYKVGKADAVTIYDCNKNELKHFISTHDEGHYGSWD